MVVSDLVLRNRLTRQTMRSACGQLAIMRIERKIAKSCWPSTKRGWRRVEASDNPALVFVRRSTCGCGGRPPQMAPTRGRSVAIASENLPNIELSHSLDVSLPPNYPRNNRSEVGAGGVGGDPIRGRRTAESRLKTAAVEGHRTRADATRLRTRLVHCDIPLRSRYALPATQRSADHPDRRCPEDECNFW